MNLVGLLVMCCHYVIYLNSSPVQLLQHLAFGRKLNYSKHTQTNMNIKFIYYDDEATDKDPRKWDCIKYTNEQYE